MANHCSTKANNEDNCKTPETSFQWHNNHQGTQRKVEEIATQDKPLCSQTNTSLEEAKDSHLANDNKHREPFKEIALYVARLATILLIVHSVADSKPCLRSHNNPPRLTTFSWET